MRWNEKQSPRLPVDDLGHRANTLLQAFWTQHNIRLSVQGVLDVRSR
jgi:hypothetical protein